MPFKLHNVWLLSSAEGDWSICHKYFVDLLVPKEIINLDLNDAKKKYQMVKSWQNFRFTLPIFLFEVGSKLYFFFAEVCVL